jgi:hypothetical protein
MSGVAILNRKELDNMALKHQANVDLLGSMPDVSQFWDRLTMEFRRAKTMEKTLSLILLKVSKGIGSAKNPDTQEELQGVRAGFGVSFEIHIYPEDVVSSHEMEDLVKSLIPEQQGWDAPIPALAEKA